jgi:hypothetical protein
MPLGPSPAQHSQGEQLEAANKQIEMGKLEQLQKQKEFESEKAALQATMDLEIKAMQKVITATDQKEAAKEKRKRKGEEGGESAPSGQKKRKE